jgi:chitinase
MRHALVPLVGLGPRRGGSRVRSVVFAALFLVPIGCGSSGDRSLANGTLGADAMPDAGARDTADAGPDVSGDSTSAMTGGPDSATTDANTSPVDAPGVTDGASEGVAATPGETGATPPSGKLLVGYYQTWSDTWKANGADTVLAHLPAYVGVVNLAFMQPNTSYTQGSLSLGGTGIGVPYDGPTLRAAIAALHANSPSTKIMLSVGGATYATWSAFNAQAIAAFVGDFGIDGVDIDYEPSNPNCVSTSGSVSCPSSDSEYVTVVNAMRSAMPRPKWLSMAAWSVGAYGEGPWASAPPTGSAYMGIALAVFKDAAASAALDLVNVMSYDAGTSYSPAQALQAYQHYFSGRIAMGIEVPPEAWGGHVETLPEIDALAGAVVSSGGAGLMLWSLQKAGPAQQFATEACSQLGLGNCAAPLM